MNNTSKIIGVDLAKNVFQLALADKHYNINQSKRLNRSQFHEFFANYPTVDVVMETCGTAHYWARTLTAMGHRVRLLPEQYVRPYVHRNKRITAIPIKTEYQQALQSLHRIREQWKATRVARINALRGVLREFGILVSLGPRAAIKSTQESLESLPIHLQPCVGEMLTEIADCVRRMASIEKQLKRIAKDDRAIQQFMKINGVGLLTATALRASVQSPTQFKNGRQLSAWLGITPREHSSGDHRYLGRISKRGDKYLRTLLIHGARSAMVRIKVRIRMNVKLTKIQQWALQLEQRVGHNKATVALANKMARILWATWMHQREFDANYVNQ